MSVMKHRILQLYRCPLSAAPYCLIGCLFLFSGMSCRAQRRPIPADLYRIESALRQHDFTQALRLCKSYLAVHASDYRVWTLEGMAATGAGNLKQARESYRHALQLIPNYLPALEGAAQAEIQLGGDGARPLLEKILKQQPNDPMSNALLGTLDARDGKCTNAVEHFARAQVLISNRPGLLTQYGSCLAELNHDKQAVDIFAKALALNPEKHEARYNLALAQWNAHDSDAALKTIEPLLTGANVAADALVLAAEIHESNQDTAEAVKLLRKALLVDPKDMDAYMQFASVSFNHASPKVGIDILNLGLTQLPKEPRLYLLRGILLTRLGEFARASDDFETANRLDPSLQFLGVSEGLVQSQQHNSPAALAKFRAAVKAHPNEAYAHYLLAEALAQEGKPEGSPEYKEAVNAARKAVRLDPDLVVAHDLLGSLYYENGHLDLSIEQSRAALARDPNDEQAVYHLILALRKTGSKDELRTLVKRLMELRAKAKNQSAEGKRYRLYESQK